MNKDFEKSAGICGIESHLKDEGHLFVDGNKIISSQSIDGLEMKANETSNGIEAEAIVKKGVKIKNPIFFCFGVAAGEGEQFIIPKIELGEDSELHLFAHCSFPNAQSVKHQMEGFFHIGKNAKLFYHEYHYHGSLSGAVVIPKLKIEIEEGGYYKNDFNLTRGTVGKVNIDLEAVLMKNAQTELDVKVMGKGKNDEVNIFERVYLVGEKSRSLIKMRAAAKNGGRVLMQGETYAQAAGCQGHVDCQEIVLGKNSIAKAVPIVEVNNDEARVTHEASVGRVNQKELETLMTRGLSEEEATDLIVKGMLR